MRAILPVIAGAAVLAVGGGSLAYAGLRSDVTLAVDGQAVPVTTTASTVGDLLAAQHIAVGPHDVVAPSAATALHDGTRVSVQFGRQVTVAVDGAPQTLWTTATDVGSAIAALGLDTTGADLSTSRSTPIGRQGLELNVATPKRVTITAGGKKRALTTTGATVGAALTAAGIEPDRDDQVSVPVTTTLKNGARVRFVRVDVTSQTRRSDVSYKTVSKKSSKLDRGKTQTRTAGREGSRTTTYRVVSHDGEVVSRKAVKVVVTRRPVTRVLVVGTRKVETQTASGSTAGVANVGLWDKIAACESGGNWSINTGNGYYGGLQFSLATWRAYGGTGMPNQQSKAAQIAVAERVRKGSGLGNWSCA
ncbi:MAG: ubiquitin-like domain-containing protein [Janthinobacterium lividum]